MSLSTNSFTNSTCLMGEMHPDMSQQAWSTSFQEAFEDFQVAPKPGLDRYGATNPAEFFAVLGEVFFYDPFL